MCLKYFHALLCYAYRSKEPTLAKALNVAACAWLKKALCIPVAMHFPTQTTAETMQKR